MKCVPPQKRRYIIVHKSVVQWRALHIAGRIEQRRDLHTEEHICVIEHLFVLQTAGKPQIANMRSVCSSRPANLDETGEDWEGGLVDACGRLKDGDNGLGSTWANGERSWGDENRRCGGGEWDRSICWEDGTLTMNW